MRDLVLQVLENNGTLGKLKSQLRESVFLALENDTKLKSVAQDKDDSKLSCFLKSSDGLDALSLCRDLLSSLNLTYSLNVLDSELRDCLGGVSVPPRQNLCARIGVDIENLSTATPLIANLVANQKANVLCEKFGITSAQLDVARQYFNSYESMGCVSYEGLLTSLTKCFPSLEKSVMQQYCSDHYQDNVKSDLQINFDEFLTLYCYFSSTKNNGIVSADTKKTSEPDVSKKEDNKPAGDDEWNDDPLDLLPKISRAPNSRTEKVDFFSTARSPAKKSNNDGKDSPDESFFDNEVAPWENNKAYEDDFMEETKPQKGKPLEDCKVTSLSDESEESDDNRPSGERERPASPQSSSSDYTVNTDLNPAAHPRLANVQFLEDVDSTKF